MKINKKLLMTLGIGILSLHPGLFVFPGPGRDAPQTDRIAAQMGKDFTQQALEGLRRIVRSTSSPLWKKVENATLEYATERPKILLGGGVAPEKVESLMDRSASWYGDLILRMYRGEKPETLAEEYIQKVNILFEEINIPEILHSKILLLIKSHFNTMGEYLLLLAKSR